MKKQTRKRFLKQAVSLALCASLLAPNVTPIVAEAAAQAARMPRQVDFSRPEALKLGDLRLASGSNGDGWTSDEDDWILDEDDLILDEDAWMEEDEQEQDLFVHRATDSNAQLREPEAFYEELIDEPDGILVEFNDLYRTYQIGDGEFVSIIGGYSGMYLDEDGVVRETDNRLAARDEGPERPSGQEQEPSATPSNADGSVEPDEDSDKYVSVDSDVEADDATPSNVVSAPAKPKKQTEKKPASKNRKVTFYNRAGAMEVELPQVLGKEAGIRLETDGHVVELTPEDGDFGNSVAAGNAIRYTEVYPGIDYQYTLLGNVMKEDIILMEPTDRTSFSYVLEPGGLKVSKVQNRIVLYEDSREQPVFTLQAPVMEDASGEISFDIQLSLKKKGGTYRVTITADEDWLSAPERTYPVRIDPSLQKGPLEFKVVSVASGRPDQNFSWTKPPYVGYDDGTNSGNTPPYENCRVYFSLGTEEAVWDDVPRDQEIVSAAFSVGQQTDWSGGTSVFALEAPNEKWSIATSWDQQKDLSFTRLGTQKSPGKDGRFSYDITPIMKEWLAGTRTQIGLCMRAIEEPGVSGTEDPLVVPCEILYNQDSIGYGPRLEWTWNGELKDVSLMDVDDTTLLVDPVILPAEYDGRVTMAALAYGDTQAGATVHTTLKESGETDEVTASGTLDSPDFTCDGAYPDALEKMKNHNWQSNPFETGTPDPDDPVTDEEYGDGYEVQLNTEYYFETYAEGYELEEDPETGELIIGDTPKSSKPIESDHFLLYRVKKTDYLPRIANYYQVEYSQMIKDNRLRDDLTLEGDVLFIRNPGRVPDEPYNYTDPTKEEQFLIDLLLKGRGKDCVFAHEPVNMNTGNFYMEQTDAELPELSGTFALTRSYNSIGADYRSEFGIGWNSPIGEHLMRLSDGSVVWVKEDGGGLAFTEKDGVYQAPDGYDYELRTTETVVERPDEDEEEDEEDGADKDAKAEADKTGRGKNGEADADVDETEEDGEETPEYETDIVMGWELEAADGSLWTFNQYGLLTSRSDRKGHKTVYEYDEAFLLTGIVTPSGKEFPVEMDEEGKILSIGLPDGGQLSYEYDDRGHLVSVTNPAGDVRRYEYNDDHQMTAWYDENGTCVVENEYDEKGRVLVQTDALGSQARMSYEDGYTLSTDNRGNTTRYELDDQNRLTAVHYPDGTVTYRNYTADNRLESETDGNGASTHYEYDENGNVTKETREDGSYSAYTYNELNLPLTIRDYEGHVTRFTYDEKGNLLSQTNGAGDTTRYEYDDLSRVTAMTDGNGGVYSFTYEGESPMPSSLTDPEGGVTTVTYDEMNRVLTQTDPEGHQTEHSYNENGWEISVTTADGGETLYEFSPAGEVLSITDPMGVETVFTYDAMHNITSGEDALGHTLTYGYDGNYNRVSETNAKGDTTTYGYDARNRITAVTDALGHTMTYTLDGSGHTTAITDRRGNTTETWYHQTLGLPTMERDALGNETYYQYDHNGNLTQIRYPDGSSVSYTYDGAGRLQTTTAANGLVTEMAYDGNGNIIRITDDETRVYRFDYDGNNRLITATDPLGGVTEYQYDGAGNQIRTTDANDHSTDYAYDAVGRLTQITNALGGTVTSEYDLNGHTLSTTDENGHATTWHYDAIGQLLAQADAAGNITAMEYDVVGNVAKITDALKGETVMETDALSQTVQVTDALGGVTTYEYDENGNLLTTTYPDGDSVHLSYDANNRLSLYRDEADVITRYEYDSMGRLAKAQDTAGNVMTYTYDESGNLVKQTDTIGRDALYGYDRFGRLETVTGTDGATTTYGYDALDRLTSVTLADGTVTTYEYDPAGNLLTTTEPGEAVYTYAYDAINRVTKEVNPVGAATTFQYDAKGNLTLATDGEGNQNGYTYDELDRLTTLTDRKGSDTGYEYDELSRLLAVTTPEGNRSEYRYDALGRMIKEKDPNGLITEYQYDPMGNLLTAISPKGATTQYTYDKHDELTSETDPDGNLTRYTVDMNRRVTEITQKNGAKYQYTYDEVHRLTGITTPLGLEQTFTYDTADNLVRSTDSLGRTTEYQYDILHRLIKETNAKGGETTYGYDIRGNQNALTNAMGHTWTFTYDLIDQLTESVDPEGKATKAVYDLAGNITSITRPGDRRTEYQYDQNYNTTVIQDPKGYLYQTRYDKDNRPVGTTDPLQQTESLSYDPGSRVTSLTDKMGLNRSFTYDAHGNVVTAVSTDGLNTHFTYDILDNLTSVTDPMGRTTSYQYDVMGNITSMTDAKQQVTTYTYDAENNLTSLTSPMGRVEQYLYDIGGRLSERVTPSGNRIFYDYDTLNALAEKSYHNSGELANDHPVQMGYNQMGQRISMEDLTGDSSFTYDSLGRLKTATNGSGKTVTYEYDEADNLSAIVYPDGKKVSYQYDKNDNITSLTDRDGRSHTFAYDPLNRLTHVTRSDGSESAYTYNARNQVLQVTNTCVCGFLISDYQYTYDDVGLIVKEVAKECLFASNKDYGHEGGSKEKCAHKSDNLWQNQNPEWETTTRNYTYDDNGQLLRCDEKKSAFNKNTYTYEYDEAGNRIFAKKEKLNSYLESWQIRYTYNEDNQMVTAKVREGNLTKDYTFQYDANGNLTKECFKKCAEVTYQYDAENRLTAVYDQQKLLMASVYDGDGNRAFQLNYNPEAECGYGMNVSGEIFMPEHSTNEDGSLTAEGTLFSYICSETGRAYDLTEYVNDTNREYTEVLMAYNINSGVDTESYTYAGRMRISRNNYWNEARDVNCDEMSYYLYDGRGSVTANTWYNGMVTATYQYDPYGQMEHGSTKHTDFYGYNGESYNPNTGLVYLRARYYNGNQGRFFQEDTYLGEITDPLTLNRYAYGKNSPLNYVDPSGHVADYLTGGNSYSGTPYAAAQQNQSNWKPEKKNNGPIFHATWNATEAENITADNVDSCTGRKMVEEGDWQYEALTLIEDLRNNPGYFSTGLVAGGSFMIWSGSGTIGIVVDGQGNVAFVRGGSFNVGSPDVGIMAGVYGQNMPTVPNYISAGGESGQWGGTISGELIGIPVSVGKETNLIEDLKEGKEYYGDTLTFSLSLSMSPGEVHAGVSNGNVEYWFNYLDELEDAIWLTVSES